MTVEFLLEQNTELEVLHYILEYYFIAVNDLLVKKYMLTVQWMVLSLLF